MKHWQLHSLAIRAVSHATFLQVVTESFVAGASHMGFGAFRELSVLCHENYEHVRLIVYRVSVSTLLTPHLELVRSDSSVFK